MTHDPLCPAIILPSLVLYACQCNLIAKVREDTIAAAVQRVEALDWSILYESERNPLRDAIAAIRGDQE